MLRCFSFILIFIFKFSLAAALLRKTESAANIINRVKKDATRMVINNHREEAIVLLDEKLTQNENPEIKAKLNEIKFNILNQFLSLSAQEAFEIAASAILNEKKKALYNLQLCLSLEPDNLQCQWLELKYLKYYNVDAFAEKALKYIEKIQNFRQSQFLKYSLYLTLGQTNDVSANLKMKPTQPEDEYLNNIISFHLAVQTHDLKRAKEALNFFSSKANDYPDLIFMVYQSSLLWPELNFVLPSDVERQYEVYRKKCSDLPASTARKYLYDIALCTRSLK